jgi:predicted metal-binding membrane protein
MIAAMMLPTTFPLLAMFRRITGSRPDAGRLAALVVLGFVAAWLVFGLVAHGVDAAIAAASGNGWFVAHGAWIGAAVLAGAGSLPVEPLKYRCLDECRTPFGFVASRWHGVSPRARPFASASTTASSASAAAGR